MATVGNTSAPSTNYDYGTYSGQQAASWFAMPSPGGSITDIHVYAKTESGSSHSGYVCIWDDSGNLLTYASCTIPGSEGWFSGTLGTPYFIASGTAIWIGVQTSDTSTSGVYIHYNSSGSSTVDMAHNSTRPGALASITQHTSSVMGVYADYTPSEGWIWNGSSWVAGEVVINTGTSGSPVWSNPTGLDAYSGSSWVQAS